MNILIYDCEIIKCIPDKNGLRKSGLEYCKGWDDHANMGISLEEKQELEEILTEAERRLASIPDRD